MAKKNNEKMLGNKGEWTELYVMLKLLAQGEVQVINEQSEKDENIYYPIVRIMREEYAGKPIDYVINGTQVMIVEVQSGEIMTIDRSVIKKQADYLRMGIENGSGDKFELPEIEDFAKSIKVTTIKADPNTKNDIFIQICDKPTQPSPSLCLGFSIKSYLGELPTLANPSKTTNFVYKVEGLTCEQKDEINKIKGIPGDGKISRRMDKIRYHKGKLLFDGRFGNESTTEIFKSNLTMIDKDMPEILAEMLLDFYNNKGSGNEGIGNCKTLIKNMKKRNPLGYEDADMYEYKFKKFLSAWALGMVSADPWSGFDEVNGGCIIVKADGEISAYRFYNRKSFKEYLSKKYEKELADRIYNRNSFEQYLLYNTELETPSTGRYEFMTLYEENGEMFINLNLQIRFKNMQLKDSEE